MIKRVVSKTLWTVLQLRFQALGTFQVITAYALGTFLIVCASVPIQYYSKTEHIDAQRNALGHQTRVRESFLSEPSPHLIHH
jgi:hypothetical protein